MFRIAAGLKRERFLPFSHYLAPILLQTHPKNNNCSSRTSHSYAETMHIDKWYASIVKPLSFYEDQACEGKKDKRYFYNVDLQGRVFLEETLPKNIATSLKSPSFLKSFFRRIRKINQRERQLLSLLHCEDDYPFVSPCGIEKNFIRPADSVFVFHTLNYNNMGDSNDEVLKRPQLVYGQGFLTQPFLPNKLAISRNTGRMYHPLVTIKDRDNVNSTRPSVSLHDISSGPNKGYGLIQSSLAVTLSENMVSDQSYQDGKDEEDDEYSGVEFQLEENSYPIKWLPTYAEPEPWSYKGSE